MLVGNVDKLRPEFGRYLGHGTTDLRVGRETVDSRQSFVDAHDPKIAIDELEAHGNGCLDALHEGEGFLGFAFRSMDYQAGDLRQGLGGSGALSRAAGTSLPECRCRLDDFGSLGASIHQASATRGSWWRHGSVVTKEI
jgi:hypothetical protein